MTNDTHTRRDETDTAAPVGFGRVSPPDPVDAAIQRHQGTRGELQRASTVVDAAGEADGAAWADLLATRPADVPGAVRLLRYVSGSPASEVVEDVQDLLRQLAASVEAAEAGEQAGPNPANLPDFTADPDPAFAVTAEFRRVWDAANAAARAAEDGDVPEEHLRAVDEASAALRAVRPTTPAGFRALASTWAYRLGNDLGDNTAAAHAADSLIAGAGVAVPSDPIDWHAPPDGFMASPAIEPFSFVLIEHGIKEEGRRLLGIATAEYRRRRPDRRWQIDMRSTEDGRRIARALQIETLSALAHPDHVVSLGWRWRTAGADASAGDHAPGATHGMGEGPVSADTAADPAFAAIEAHRAAYAEWDRLASVWNGMASHDRGYAEAKAASDLPGRREVEAYEALFTTRPATLRGAKALTEYLAFAVRQARFDAQPSDGERGLRSVSDHLHRLLRPGATDGAGRDWQAYAANHPGFVPYPAHAPVSLMALDLAIRGEAERFLKLAEEEIERRRQDYAGFPDPTVWPRIERDLHREMRMDALAMVASKPSDDGLPDPAFAAIDASRRAEAEMAAFGAEAAGPMTPEMRAREDALCETQRTTLAAVWATVPTTRAGRLALIDYARFQIEVQRAPDGEVDDAEDLLSEILDVLEAAIRGERPGEVSAPAADPAAPSPSNLDALALVSAIEAEWAAQARLEYQAQSGIDDDDASARRSALIAAADALPADSSPSRHAKALALAWITHLDKWRPEWTRGAYTTDGRLAFDVEASLRGMPAAEHPDADLLAWWPNIAVPTTMQGTASSEQGDVYARIDSPVLAETRRLAGMRATTLEGLIFKARWVERGAGEELKDGIVADLLAMGSGK